MSTTTRTAEYREFWDRFIDAAEGANWQNLEELAANWRNDCAEAWLAWFDADWPVTLLMARAGLTTRRENWSSPHSELQQDVATR